MTFFVKLGFWVESLMAKCYENYMDEKKVEDRENNIVKS